MKKFLLVVAGLMLATSNVAVAGPQFPNQLQGRWCNFDFTSQVTIYDKPDPRKWPLRKQHGDHCPIEDSDDNNAMTISAKSVTWGPTSDPERRCQLVKIDKYMTGWLVQFKCRSDPADSMYLWRRGDTIVMQQRVDG